MKVVAAFTCIFCIDEKESSKPVGHYYIPKKPLDYRQGSVKVDTEQHYWNMSSSTTSQKKQLDASQGIVVLDSDQHHLIIGTCRALVHPRKKALLIEREL